MSGDVLTESTGGALRDVVPFSIVATGTILTYDLLCTIDEEVEYVWKSRQSLGTVLFYLNRYTPFIDTFISLNLLTGKHSAQACERNFKVILWLIVIGTLISEYILCLRTYALWERRRSIGIALSIIYSGLFAAGIGIISIEAQSLHYEDPPLPDIPGCFMRSASSIVFIDYILILIAETIMVTLTIAKAVKHLRHTRSPLVVTLYRDGILFYFILLTVTIANVIIPVAGPPALINWLATYVPSPPSPLPPPPS
ncbi:hypothetical protein NEOLEDRAFT_325412 [Neolentinus lepideus HHB14362 ss-1]|uniref:DUF6533 domain-containing protein n=1 Tax=Neolentinus lepideus HHB14362 ss-1 TaxID=1314782 RepID=A0A165VWY7_9AGAM|nr:hypothetical protein NEOLEDRAFT_325412 [Neolentinus lepideus HHB14362 ss-1]